MSDDNIVELLNKIEKEILHVIQKNLVGTSLDTVTSTATCLLTLLGRILFMVKETEGIKRAKEIREIFCQRMHAYPLDQKEDKSMSANTH